MSNARRSPAGTSVNVSATAHFTTGASDAAETTSVRRLEPQFFLVDAAGKETRLELSPKTSIRSSPYGSSASVAIPNVPDGDYRLRAKVATPIRRQIEASLPLYAPARIHVLTDRPFGAAGAVGSAFRALGLRASDLSPLDGRPGSFSVRAPSGETVFEERAPLGDYGVTAGSFRSTSRPRPAPGPWNTAPAPRSGPPASASSPSPCPFPPGADALARLFGPGTYPENRGRPLQLGRAGRRSAESR